MTSIIPMSSGCFTRSVSDAVPLLTKPAIPQDDLNLYSQGRVCTSGLDPLRADPFNLKSSILNRKYPNRLPDDQSGFRESAPVCTALVPSLGRQNVDSHSPNPRLSRLSTFYRFLNRPIFDGQNTNRSDLQPVSEPALGDFRSAVCASPWKLGLWSFLGNLALGVWSFLLLTGPACTALVQKRSPANKPLPSPVPRIEKIYSIETPLRRIETSQPALRRHPHLPNTYAEFRLRREIIETKCKTRCRPLAHPFLCPNQKSEIRNQKCLGTLVIPRCTANPKKFFPAPLQTE
jgi:hypothetical protein